MEKQEIQNLIKELIEKTMVKTTDISITEESPTNTWFSVEVDEPHFFIGRDGEALYALNHLIRRMVESKIPRNTIPVSDLGDSGDSPKSDIGVYKLGDNILVDINGFQKKRVDSVRAVAHMMSERARYFKSNVEVDPMSAFERRVVHEFLSDADDLDTESVGFGPTRRVVIKYTGTV